MRKILFIDDDRFYALHWIEALRQRGFDVLHCHDAQDAVFRLTTDLSIGLAIVDVMMPSPEGVETECNNGLDTGVWILKQTQQVIEQQRIQIIVLTNRDTSEVSSRIEALEFPVELITVRRKLDTPRRFLSEFVAERLAIRGGAE